MLPLVVAVWAGCVTIVSVPLTVVSSWNDESVTVCLPCSSPLCCAAAACSPGWAQSILVWAASEPGPGCSAIAWLLSSWECCLQDRERRERTEHWAAREGCSLLLGNCLPWGSLTELNLQYLLFVEHTFWLINGYSLWSLPCKRHLWFFFPHQVYRMSKPLLWNSMKLGSTSLQWCV